MGEHKKRVLIVEGQMSRTLLAAKCAQQAAPTSQPQGELRELEAERNALRSVVKDMMEAVGAKPKVGADGITTWDFPSALAVKMAEARLEALEAVIHNLDLAGAASFVSAKSKLTVRQIIEGMKRHIQYELEQALAAAKER